MGAYWSTPHETVSDINNKLYQCHVEYTSLETLRLEWEAAYAKREASVSSGKYIYAKCIETTKNYNACVVEVQKLESSVSIKTLDAEFKEVKPRFQDAVALETRLSELNAL